jgi:dTMP kinase
VPDLTIVLDLDPALVRLRTHIDHDQSGAREEQSRFDKETEQFHQRLRQAFLALAGKYAERIKVIDAAQPAERIHREIVALVEPLLQQ